MDSKKEKGVSGRNPGNADMTYDRPTGNGSSAKEIDLMEVGRTVWKKKGFVLFLTLLGAILAFAVTTLAIRPTYRSSFTAYVNNHSTTSDADIQTLNNGDTAASQFLAQTYAVIMKSRPLVEDALKKSGLDYTYEEVEDSISAGVQTNTQLLTLNITMRNAKEAKGLADAIASVAPSYIADIVEGSSMKIVSSPILADKPYSPSIPKNTAIGAIIGFLLAVVIVVIRHLSDDRIKSVEELEAKFGFSVIGTIPNFDEAANNKGKKNYGYYYAASNKTK